MRKLLASSKHPFKRHGTIQPFIAYDRDIVVGRIAAIENKAHNQAHKDKVGFFGFFECENRNDVASALLEAATNWIQERGLVCIRGPVDPSMNEICGLLIEGTPGPPFFLMSYAPKYYSDLLSTCGLKKAKDLLAWHQIDRGTPERYASLANRLEKRYGVRVRTMNMKRFDEEVDELFALYNKCWKHNWGYVPITDAEVKDLVKQLRPHADADLVLILEKADTKEPVGFGLGVPDLNLAIKPMNGKIFPFGFIKFLKAKKKIHRFRVMALAVIPEMRGKGLDSLLYLHMYKNGSSRGYSEAEFSWTLEDNTAINKPMIQMGAEPYRTYRIYEKALS